MKEETIVNKVTASGIQSLDLMAYSPTVEFVHFDIAPYLYMGLIVKEKEFRKAMETIDWASYKNKAVSIGCAVEAILPQWVFMDIASKLYPYAFAVMEGTPALHKEQLWAVKLMQQDFGIFTGQKVTLIANPHINLESPVKSEKKNLVFRFLTDFNGYSRQHFLTTILFGLTVKFAH